MSNNMQEKRGPGAPPGRRPVTYLVQKIDGCTCGNGKIINEKILVHDQTPENPTGSFPKSIAEDEFEKKYGMKPENILGPIYFKKGGKSFKSRKKKGLISRDIADMKLSMNKPQKKAIWDGWYGVVNFIENDDDKAYFCFIKEVNPQNGKERKPPLPGKVNIAELVFDNNSEDKNCSVTS